MGNIIIGKHALESLTTGMYSDSLVVFREYIQNSADAIDDAVKMGLIKAEDSKIEVQLLPIERDVIIKDNGIGIPCEEAEKTLISVGNSKKAQEASRGFRGIGRLAALSYSSKLIFETSYFGERKGTRLVIDAKKLSNRLSIQEDLDISAEDVLQDVYNVEFFREKEDSHYFNVIMKGVDEDSELDKYNLVYDYLAQNIPVPYDAEKFTWGKEIKLRLKNEGYTIPEYNVFLSYAGNTVPIYKTYGDNFFIDKRGVILDQIKDIQIIQITDSKGDISAYGWLAISDYRGSIYDKGIKGLRVRKGNILIGDGQTLNVCFKDARFNGWTLGEIFVVDPKLIPNARRDNFEKTPEYFIFTEQIKNIAVSIVKEIRNASVTRNTELSNVLYNPEDLKSQIDEALGLEDRKIDERGALKRRLINARSALKKFSSSNDVDLYNREIAFEEIDMLIGKIQGTTAYKSLNAMKNLSKVEKQTLEKVFDIIVSTKPEEAEELIESILKVFISG